jgi:phage-related protein
MASKYGELSVDVRGDTGQLESDVAGAAAKAGQSAAQSISQSMTSGLKAIGGFGLAVGKSVATGLGAASAAAIGFGVASFQTAARVGEMDASLRALAKANKLSYPEMQKTVTQIRGQGIEAGTAQTLVAQFAQSQLKLSDATKLATVAQDAAVISGRNSTEVLADLVHGVTTQNSQVLKNAGLNVMAGQAMDAYAKSLGKATKDLTSAERAQAVLNGVLEDGKTIAGAYKEAMKEPGKVLRSFKRVVDDVKLSVGQGLVKAFAPAILGAYSLAKAFSEAVAPGGALSPIFDAIGAAVARLTAPLEGLIAKWTAWLNNLKPGDLDKILGIIKQFGPALIIAGAALAAFTGAGALGGLPVIGGLLTTILGPLRMIGPLFLTLAKSAAGVVLPLLGIKGGLAGVAAALGPIGWIIGLVVAAFALMTATSAKFRDGLLAVAKGLGSFFMPIIKSVMAGVKDLIPPVMEIARAFGDFLGPALVRLAPLLGPIGALIGGVLTVAFGLLAVQLRIMAIAFTAVMTVLGRLVEMIPVGPIQSFSSAVAGAISAAAAFLNPLRLLQGVLEWLGNAISAVVRWIFGGSPGLIPAFLAAAAAAGPLMAILSALAGVFSFLAGAVAAAWSAIVSATSSAWSAVSSIVSGAVAAVRSAVTSGFAAARSAVSSAMSGISSAVSSGMNSARSAVSSATSAMVSAIRTAGSGMVSAMRSSMSQVAGAVSSGLASAVGAARAGGAAIMNGLQAGINSAAGAVMSTISSVASRISGALSSALKIGSPSKLTIEMGRELIRGLEVGWDRESRTATFDVPSVGISGSATFGGSAVAGLGGGLGSVTVNVYPSAGMDEQQLAAKVSRELSWAQAAGVAS